MACIHKFDIPHLDVGAVAKHYFAQAPCCSRAIDRPVIAVLHKSGEVAAVINVRMREDDGIELRGVERERAVSFEGFFPPTMVNTAIQQHASIPDMKKMHCPGDCSGSSPEFERDTHTCGSSGLIGS